MPKIKVDLIALDRALEGLARVDERKYRVIETRFFAGPSVDDWRSRTSAVDSCDPDDSACVGSPKRK